MKNRIVIAGKNNIAIDVCKYILRHYPAITIYALYNENDSGEDSFQRSFKNFCAINSVKSISLSQAYSIADSIFLSLEYDKIVNPDLFSHGDLFNIHFSDLPHYRGMYTSCWPLINNETHTATTLHYIDKGIDTGPIIDKATFVIDDNETAATLYHKYISCGTDVVIKNIQRLLKGSPKATEQAGTESYYGKRSLDFDNLEINFNKKSRLVKKQILAFTFRHYQLPTVKGHAIFGCQISTRKSDLCAGEIVSETDNAMIVATRDYDLIIYKDCLDHLFNLIRIKETEKSIKILSENPFLINEKDSRGRSALSLAAELGNHELVCFLVENGADADDYDYQGTGILD